MATKKYDWKKIKSACMTTISKQAGAYGMGAGNDDVVYAVNTGFTNLNAKLEELSSRQDNQEAVLRELTSSKKSNLMTY